MEQQIFNEIKQDLLGNILPYWQKFSRDTSPETEGFWGEISSDNIPDKGKERSIVMTSRFLWAYSAIARLTGDSSYLDMADFAYRVITKKYIDTENGGVYWSVMPDGTPKVSKKQIYGEAFCCYGLSEYAAAIRELREGESLPPGSHSVARTPPSPRGKNSGADFPPKTPGEEAISEQAMNLALDIFYLLEKHALDSDRGGYVEARARDWTQTDDMILSPKDMNCAKSMNTNLHVMEAYTNLYRTLSVVFPEAKSIRAEVGSSLADLVRVTVDKILQPNAHLGMFFDMDWKLLMDEISYGHDIEASWLLWEAACELDDEELKSEIRDTVIRVAQVALDEGFDKENGCMENFLRDGGKRRDRTRVWWNQAEALNGFYNAWEMTGGAQFSQAVAAEWSWIKNHQIDKKGGEWWSALDENAQPVLAEPKGGNWKTAYHSARAGMELLRRSKNL